MNVSSPSLTKAEEEVEVVTAQSFARAQTRLKQPRTACNNLTFQGLSAFEQSEADQLRLLQPQCPRKAVIVNGPCCVDVDVVAQVAEVVDGNDDHNDNARDRTTVIRRHLDNGTSCNAIAVRRVEADGRARAWWNMVPPPSPTVVRSHSSKSAELDPMLMPEYAVRWPVRPWVKLRKGRSRCAARILKVVWESDQEGNEEEGPLALQREGEYHTSNEVG